MLCLFFSTNNILYPSTVALVLNHNNTTLQALQTLHYHYQTQHYQNQPYQLNPTTLTMSAPSDLVCGSCCNKEFDCDDTVCFFCHKELSIDHPVILVQGESGHERAFGIECLVHWQNTIKGCCVRNTVTYGWTKDPRVDADLTKYGGLLRDSCKPQRRPTPAGEQPSWLARYLEDFKYKCLCAGYSQLMKVRTTTKGNKVPLGAYPPQSKRHIPLPTWDGVAPLLAIPSKSRACPHPHESEDRTCTQSVIPIPGTNYHLSF
jgi:hypothetical protein